MIGRFPHDEQAARHGATEIEPERGETARAVLYNPPPSFRSHGLFPWTEAAPFVVVEVNVSFHGGSEFLLT